MTLLQDDLDIVLDAALGWASELDFPNDPESRIRDAITRIRTDKAAKDKLRTLMTELSGPGRFATYSIPWAYLTVSNGDDRSGWTVKVNEIGAIESRYISGDVERYDEAVASIKTAFVDVTHS